MRCPLTQQSPEREAHDLSYPQAGCLVLPASCAQIPAIQGVLPPRPRQGGGFQILASHGVGSPLCTYTKGLELFKEPRGKPGGSSDCGPPRGTVVCSYTERIILIISRSASKKPTTNHLCQL